METIYQMKVRHKAERVALVVAAIRSAGSVSGAAAILGINRSILHRELRDAGIKPSEVNSRAKGAGKTEAA